MDHVHVTPPAGGAALLHHTSDGGCRRPLGHDGRLWLGPLLLRDGCAGHLFLFGLHDAHVVREGLLGADLTAGVPGQHDLHLNAQYT